MIVFQMAVTRLHSIDVKSSTAKYDAPVPSVRVSNGSRDGRGLLEIINFICLQSTERTFPGVVTAVGPVRIRPNGFGRRRTRRRRLQ